MTPRRLPAIISPSDVSVGDTITVTKTRGDVKESATAVVGRIIRTSSTVSFISPDGNSFGTFSYGSNFRLMLVAVGAKVSPEPLFDLERIS